MTLRKITKLALIVGASGLTAPALAQDVDLEEEVTALRAQVAELEAREAAANARLEALEQRLMMLDARAISAMEADGIRGMFIPPQSLPMSNNPELDIYRSRTRPMITWDPSRLAVLQPDNTPAGAGPIEGEDDEEVQKAPDPTEAVQDIVQQQQGVQRSRFGIEHSLGYSRFSDARINLDGFLALDAIFLGSISIDEVNADIFTSETTFRFAATDDLFLDASVPFLYRTSIYRSGGAGGAASIPVEAKRSNGGLGDISVGASYQLMTETLNRPNVVLSGRVKFPTGDEPFGIDFIEVAGSEGNLKIPERLATGSGVYGASGGISVLKTIDPMVVFGSLTYFHNFKRDFADIDENPGDQPGTVAIGDAFQFGAGLAFALNDRSSISMSYTQRLVNRTKLRLDSVGEFQRVLGSDANVALVNIGATFALGDRLSLIGTVGMGLTDDSPDMVVSVRLPYRF